MKKLITLLALPLLLAACQASVMEDANEVPTNEAAMEGDVAVEDETAMEEETGMDVEVEAETEVEAQ